MDEQIVIFQLAGECYAVDVERVQGIIQMQAITVIPGAPPFIEGVINLRGAVVPVVDLRARFGFTPRTLEQRSVILIVELGEHQVGMVTDRVTDVTHIPGTAIEPPSPLLTSVDTAYLRGIARHDGQLLILLNLDRVFSTEEQQALTEAA